MEMEGERGNVRVPVVFFNACIDAQRKQEEIRHDHCVPDVPVVVDDNQKSNTKETRNFESASEVVGEKKQEGAHSVHAVPVDFFNACVAGHGHACYQSRSAPMLRTAKANMNELTEVTL